MRTTTTNVLAILALGCFPLLSQAAVTLGAAGNFAILAEGPVDEIRKFQVEIDDYLTRLEAVPAGTAS